jgi:hypothetical protein
MGILTPEETVREHNRGKKAAGVIGVSLGRTGSNAMNIMKDVGRPLNTATILNFNNTAKKTRG